MKKKIILHGYLGQLYPHDIEVEAATVADAIRSLQQIPELTAGGRPHPVRITDVESEIALYSPTEMSEIHVHPMTGGGGGNKQTWTQIAIGAVLIGIALINPTFAYSIGKMTLLSSSAMFWAGAGLVLGGALQLLAPEDEENNRQSNVLAGDKNTVALGTPITLAYGFAKLGGQYLSFDVDAVTTSGDPNPSANPETSEIRYVEHDKTPAPWAVLLPRYNSKTTGPLNVPASNWVDA